MLIAESGSTKTDWVLVKNGVVYKRYKTMGYNPFFHNETIIYNSIKQDREMQSISNQVDYVYFYGAGCSSNELNAIVEKALQRVFTKASILVDHDLLACALATYQGEPAISCILGTGSNSCLFDGENLIEQVPALGYILGDEGSGSYYGKKLISHAEKLITKNNLKKITINVLINNQKAKKFYEKNGFTVFRISKSGNIKMFKNMEE